MMRIIIIMTMMFGARAYCYQFPGRHAVLQAFRRVCTSRARLRHCELVAYLL